MQRPNYSVVQVIDQLNIGGAEQVLVMLANLLHEHGHTVSVITTVAPGPLAGKLHKNISVINLQRKWKWNLVTMFRLVKVLRRFDVVHVHSFYNLRYVFVADQLFFLRKQIFYHEHYGDININTTVSWQQRFIYPKTIFITVSKQLAVWAIEKIKLSPQKVFVLQNTVIKQTADVRSEQPVHKKLLLVSNFRPTKNILFALEILKRLNKTLPEFHLTIIGQKVDEKYYSSIVFFIQENHLQQEVAIVHDCENIQPLLHQYVLALHTAISETGPLVLIEYLAQNLPFVTYNTGEVVQQVKQFLPQFVLDTFSADDWIKRIKDMVAAPQQNRQLQQLYQQYFSTEEYYDKCMAIYKASLK